MKSSEYSRITDELLSAYIDNAVTDQERKLVEAAVTADAEVAWRLDTLQQTVQLLRTLPELALPRSFVLQETQLLNTPYNANNQVSAQATKPALSSRIANSWHSFWRPGNAVYRNLAAVSLVLLLVVVGSSRLALPTFSPAAPAAELAFSERPADVIESTVDARTTDAAVDMATGPAEEAAVAAQLVSAEPAVEEAAAAESMAEEPMVAEPLAEDTAEGEALLGDSAASEPEAQAAAARSPEAENEVAAMDAIAASESAAAEEPVAAESALEESDASELAAPARVLMDAPAESSEPEPPSAQAAAAPAEGDAKLLIEESESATIAGALLADDASPDAAAGITEGAMLQVFEESQEESPLPAAVPLAASALADEQSEPPADAPEAVAALPVAPATSEPTPTAQALSAAESPQTTPYPQPEPTPSRFDFEALALLQILAAGLLAATILFGGLWWRSRSATQDASDAD